MTKMKDIIELLQQLKSRKLYEEYVREFDRINVHYFNCKDENNKIYFINCYNFYLYMFLKYTLQI